VLQLIGNVPFRIFPHKKPHGLDETSKQSSNIIYL